MRTHYSGKLTAALLGQAVTLAGWAHRRRDHGGVIFIDLRDREGLAQVVSDPDRKEAFAAAERIRNEFVLKVTGVVRRRPEGTVNPNIASGEVEVLAHGIEILNPSLAPPFQLDDDNLSETVRLTHRVIDLRREAMQKNMMLRYRAAMAVRKYLDANGFIDIETPMLTPSTTAGPRDYLVPSRVHPGECFARPAQAQRADRGDEIRRFQGVFRAGQHARAPGRRIPRPRGRGAHARRDRHLHRVRRHLWRKRPRLDQVQRHRQGARRHAVAHR